MLGLAQAESPRGETRMKRIACAAAAATATLAFAASAAGADWAGTVPFTNQVASSPTVGGGYPVPPSSTRPEPGTCYLGPYNANHSESWLAVKPGTETLTGASKF